MHATDLKPSPKDSQDPKPPLKTLKTQKLSHFEVQRGVPARFTLRESEKRQ